MTRPLQTLGQRLKVARKKCGLSQGDLASAVGLQQSDISKLETGRSHKTTAMAGLVRVLRVPSLWLETGDGPAPDWWGDGVVETRAKYEVPAPVNPPIGAAPLPADAMDMATDDDQRSRLLRAFTMLLAADRQAFLERIEARAAEIAELEERLRRERPNGPAPDHVVSIDRRQRHGTPADREIMIRPGDPTRYDDVGNVG